MLDANNQLQPVKAVNEWGLNSEPWVFTVGRDGIVKRSFNGMPSDQELKDAIAEIAAPLADPRPRFRRSAAARLTVAEPGLNQEPDRPGRVCATPSRRGASRSLRGRATTRLRRLAVAMAAKRVERDLASETRRYRPRAGRRPGAALVAEEHPHRAGVGHVLGEVPGRNWAPFSRTPISKSISRPSSAGA